MSMTRNTFGPMRLPFFLLVLLLVAAGRAQTDPKVFVPHATTVKPLASSVVQASAGDSGNVVIHEPAAVSALMKTYKTSKQPLKGFRVQIFLGERVKAEETRRSFMVKHPNIPAYLSYLAPNFRVRVGDELTKRDAEHLRLELQEHYNGLYVVPDDIELPRLGD
jgi:hypothetical protein